MKICTCQREMSDEALKECGRVVIVPRCSRCLTEYFRERTLQGVVARAARIAEGLERWPAITLPPPVRFYGIEEAGGSAWR
jgi:hypothetical protein